MPMQEGAPAAQSQVVNPEARRILTAIGACREKIDEYSERRGGLRELWCAADFHEQTDVVFLLFNDIDGPEHKALCPMCGGTLPPWERIEARLIERGLLPDERCLIFPAVYSKSEAGNG